MRLRVTGVESTFGIVTATRNSTPKDVASHTSKDKKRKNVIPNCWMTPVRLFQLILVLTLGSVTVMTSRSTLQHSPFLTLHHLSSQHRKTGRFPKYGSEEFSRQCNWTVPIPGTPNPKCAYFVRPKEGLNAGLGLWTPQIVQAYLFAMLTGCKVQFDYGEGVDLRKVITPFPTSRPEDHVHNWTTPSSLECGKCHSTTLPYLLGAQEMKGSPSERPNFQHVPQYRYAYKSLSHSKLYGDSFLKLQQQIPGFQLETGMACALGNLFNLSPSAAEFEPKLFTEIIPTIQDEDALVIALYVRTGRADELTYHERNNSTAPEVEKGKHDQLFNEFAKSAFCLEKKHLSGVIDLGTIFTRVIWMVVSDSPEVKRSATERFHGGDVNSGVQKGKAQVVRREVLSTSARGIHVRPRRNPSTSEFAEAFIDWYLIGESDVVVTDKVSSFGTTATLRTNRPLYHIGSNCSRVLLIYEHYKRTEKTR